MDKEPAVDPLDITKELVGNNQLKRKENKPRRREEVNISIFKGIASELKDHIFIFNYLHMRRWIISGMHQRCMV